MAKNRATRFDGPVAPIDVINTVPHQLTGVQSLWHLMHHWQIPGKQATIFIVESGRTDAMMNTIRVALSRERAKHNAARTFELRYSDPIPYAFESHGMVFDAELFVLTKSLGGKVTQMTAAFESLRQHKQLAAEALTAGGNESEGSEGDDDGK